MHFWPYSCLISFWHTVLPRLAKTGFLSPFSCKFERGWGGGRVGGGGENEIITPYESGTQRVDWIKDIHIGDICQFTVLVHQSLTKCVSLSITLTKTTYWQVLNSILFASKIPEEKAVSSLPPDGSTLAHGTHLETQRACFNRSTCKSC